MDRIQLVILYKDGSEVKSRAIVNKWKFQDTMMGEQFISFTLTSETPITWAVGDYCVFRGEIFTLNYIPSVTQSAASKERQNAYTYDNVKFDSAQDELGRCLMLDITSTTGEYVAALGTNHTGSSRFQLYCGETSTSNGTLTAVCALAAKIQANLDRMYTDDEGDPLWQVLVDTTSTYQDSTGATVLVTHTDDKMMQFDNMSVSQALAEVHNTFDLDYCVKGRTIYIGYTLKNLVSDTESEVFYFGYGKGYPTISDPNKALFEIKRVANSQQQIVTRLRALGSTKNLPYRYYNKKYGSDNTELSQTLFPTNLQLPGTFLSAASKASQNASRDTIYGVDSETNIPYMRHVLGDTNDSYIEKDDDAAGSAEGIREGSARWDGSDSNLPEIYPTIEKATYSDLRTALVTDQDGNSGSTAFPNYGDGERIDELLLVGYTETSEENENDVTVIDDANIGEGILPEEGLATESTPFAATIGQTTLTFRIGTGGDFTASGDYLLGKEKTLFSVSGVTAGNYAMAPTFGAVVFGFNLSKTGCSADVGYMIKIKKTVVETGVESVIGTYISEFVTVADTDIVEMELPSLPDAVNGDNAQVSEIEIDATSNIEVTFTPLMQNPSVSSVTTVKFGLVYKVGNSRLDETVTSAPEYNWINLDLSSSITETFHVFVKDMGFNIEATFTGETPKVVMKSGYCVGREFEIGENVEKVVYEDRKGYMLTLKRAVDSSLNTYYPSIVAPLAAQDEFVLVNVAMPDVYIQLAEARLLKAASDYLADNCETQFTYQPSLDDIYLQRNYDNMVAEGTPEKSIFWRLYAGLKFSFRGIPESYTEEGGDSEYPMIDITIEQVTISMGEGLTPKVDLKLNEDIQQTKMQKLTVSVDRIYNGSLFSNGSVSGSGTTNAAAVNSILKSQGGKMFLSKTEDDSAAGKIEFKNYTTHDKLAKFKEGLTVGSYNSRLLGSGAFIDEEGNAEFESIYTRNFISTPEFRFNRIAVTDGEQWNTNGYGTIESVEILTEDTGRITLKLEENEYTSVAVGDICRGVYNDVEQAYDTANLDDDTELYAGEDESSIDGFGFSCKDGFFTSYFWITEIETNQKGECVFLYQLRNTSVPHPCAFMKFAQYGSFINSQRRSSSYSTSIGHYYEMVLDGVNTWKIKSANVVFRKGYLGNMTVTLNDGSEVSLNGYGLYVQDNVYFGNTVMQIDPQTLEDIQEDLKTYEVEFSGYVDVITVDDVGNCIGGLYTVSGDDDEYRTYRIHSAITVRKNTTLLTIADDGDDAATGTYKIYAEPHGCTCVIENSTIYITSIDNIKDGVAGSEDDSEFDYDAMRDMDSCSVDLIIDCEGVGSVQKNFPVRIKHDSQPFVNADLSNEFSALSWNTQTQAYIGLPLTFDMKMWKNNESLDVTDASIEYTEGEHTTVTGTVTDDEDIEWDTLTIDTELVIWKRLVQVNGTYVARFKIVAAPADLPLVSEFNVTGTTTYSGISYERTLVHTVNKTTDTNVYQLLPSHPTVGVTYNENKQQVIETDTIFCQITCDSTDDKHYIVSPNDYGIHNVAIYYYKTARDSDDSLTPTEIAYNTSTGIPISVADAKVSLLLYSLDSNGNTVELLDSEGVDIILEGLDGDNAVHLTIDNENDSVMALEDGTVIASTLPTAKVYLWNGDTMVTEAEHTALNSWGALVCTNCTAVYGNYDADGGRIINVTSVTDDTATVMIPCTFTSNGVAQTHNVLMSIKKLYGLDKYEIITDPTSVGYNPNTGLHNPTSFTAYIYLTTQEEDRHLLVSLPGTYDSSDDTGTDGTVVMEYSVNGGTTWTVVNNYSSGASITGYSSVTEGSVRIRVRRYFVGESGDGEWVILDQEGVDIVAGGENVVRLGLDNPNDSCTATEDGTVIPSTLPVAVAYLWDGSALVNDTLDDEDWSMTCVNCTATFGTGYLADGGKQLTVSAVTDDAASVTVSVPYKDETHTAKLTITKLYGLDKYEIITAPHAIVFDPNTNTYTPDSFIVYIYKTTQKDDRALMATLPSNTGSGVTEEAGAIRLQYSVDNGTTWTTLLGYSSGKTIANSLFNGSGVTAVDLRVHEYIAGDSGGEWLLRDQGGVEIIAGGETPVTADLENEHAGLTYNTASGAWVGLPLSTQLNVRSGDDALSPFTNVVLSIAGVSLQSTQSSTYLYTYTLTSSAYNLTATVNWNTGAIAVTALSGSNVPREINILITVTATRGGTSYQRSVIFSITTTLDLNVYELTPNVSEIIKSYTSGSASLDVASVGCGIHCISNDGSSYDLTYAQMEARGLAIYCQRYNNGVAETAWKLTTSTNTDTLLYASVASTLTKLVFILYEDSVASNEKETIPVVTDGVDGKGVEFIFFADEDWNNWDGTATSVQNLVSGGVASSDDGTPLIYDVAADRDVDNYQPYTDSGHNYQWTDEPVGTSANVQKEFYAMRKKVGGVWQAFGDVKLWNQYVTNGESPYMIDLSNEQSFVNCADDGTVTGSYESSRLMLFLGASYAFTDFTITVTPTNITCNGSTSAFTLSASDIASAQSNGYFELIPSAITADSATIAISAVHSASSLVLSAVYKINKNLAGEAGVIYSLKPSLNVIHVSNQGTFLDTTLDVEVKKIVGSSITVLTTAAQLTAENLVLTYKGSHTTEQAPSEISGLSTSTLCGTASYTKLFLRTTNSVLLDSERINTVADGDDGVGYECRVNIESVTIPADATTTTIACTAQFYRKIGDNAAALYSCYAAVYRRYGTTYVRVGALTGTGTQYAVYGNTVSSDSRNANYAEAYAFFMSDTSLAGSDYANAAPTAYLAKKEVLINKAGDTGPTADPTKIYSLVASTDAISRSVYGGITGDLPTVTAMVSEGGAEPVELTSADGFTLTSQEYAPGVSGDETVGTPVTSTTGSIVCAADESNSTYVKVTLTKNGTIYASKTFTIFNEADGVYVRDCGLFDANIATTQTYGHAGYVYREESGIVIRDMVRYEIGGLLYSFMVKNISSSALITAAPTSASGDGNWEPCGGVYKTLIANTIFGQNANIGGFMASASKLVSADVAYRAVYTNQMWSSSATYTNGTVTINGKTVPERKIVGYNSAYYILISDESSTNEGPSTNPDKWRLVTNNEMEAVTNTTSRYTDIYVLVVDGTNGVIEISRPNNTTFALGSDGRQVIGKTNGQRVELIPETQSIVIYDEDGSICMTISGEECSSLTSLFGSASGSFTIDTASGTELATCEDPLQITYNNGEQQIGYFSTVTTTSSKVIVSGTITATASRTVYNSAYISGSSDYEQSIPVDLNGYVAHRADIYVKVCTWSDSTCTTLLKQNTAKYIVDSGNGTQTNSFTAEVMVPAGYQTIYVAWNCIVYPTTNTAASVTVGWSGITASIASDVYISRQLANGFAYGSSAENFFAALNINGSSGYNMQMSARTRNNSTNKVYGFDLDHTYGLQVCRNNVLAAVFPTVLYAYVTYTGSAYAISSYYTCDGSALTVSTTSSRAVLNFGNSIQALGLAFSNTVISLTSVSQAQVSASIYSFTTSSITIECSAIGAVVTGAFIIEIKYRG